MKQLISVFQLALLIIFTIGQGTAQNSFVNAPSASSGVATNGEDATLNYNNGTANISIPLFTLSDAGNSLPISLGYQTGGIRVSQPASEVGLGWNLNAGGMIMREIKGFADDLANGTFDYIDGSVTNTELGLYRRSSCDIDESDYPLLDTEPDIFSYNILGATGKFFFDAEGQIVQISESDVIVELLTGICEDDHFNEWRITLPNATQIYIGGENAVNVFAIENEGDPVVLRPITTWYIKRIEFPNGRDMHFSYVENNQFDYIINSQSAIIDEYSEVISSVKRSYEEIKKSIQNNVLIDKIISDNFHVEFIHEIRSDIVNRDFEGTKRIAGILHKSSEGECVSSVTFKQSYFESSDAGLFYPINYEIDGRALDGMYDTKRLKLDEVSFNSCTNDEAYVVDFTYIDEDQVPRRLSCSQDLWGYHNGVMDNNSLVPKIAFSSACFGSFDLEQINLWNLADRRTNATVAEAGSLRKIVYPNGYYNEFEYEPHQIYEAAYDPFLSSDEDVSFTSFTSDYDNVNQSVELNIYNLLFSNRPHKLIINSLHNNVNTYDVTVLSRGPNATSYNIVFEETYDGSLDENAITFVADNLANDFGWLHDEEYDVKVIVNVQSVDGSGGQPVSFTVNTDVKFYDATLQVRDIDIGGLRVSTIKNSFYTKSFDYDHQVDTVIYNPDSESNFRQMRICKDCDGGQNGSSRGDEVTSRISQDDGVDNCSGNQVDYFSNFYIPCDATSVKLRLNVYSGQCDGNSGAAFSWTGVQSGTRTKTNNGTGPVDEEYVLYDADDGIAYLQPGTYYNLKLEAYPATVASNALASLSYTVEGGSEVELIPEKPLSSGTLIDVPAYISLFNSANSPYAVYEDEECHEGNAFQIHSSPTTRFASLNGGHIVYGKVTEKILNGKFGKSEYYFNTDEDFLKRISLKNNSSKVLPLFFEVPTVETVHVPPTVGLPILMKMYNAEGEVVTESSTDYLTDDLTYRFFRSRDYLLCGAGSTEGDLVLPKTTFYDLHSYWVRPIRSTSKQDGISTVSTITYRSDKAHHMPIKTTVYVENGQSLDVTKVQYAQDVADNFPFKNALIDMNAVSIPLITLRQNGVKGGTKSEYSVVLKNSNPSRMILRSKAQASAYVPTGSSTPVWKVTEEVVDYHQQIFPKEIWSKFKPLNTTYAWEDDLIQSTTYGIRTTNYAYDSRRRLKSITDPVGLVNSVEEYDGFNRSTKSKQQIANNEFIETSKRFNIRKDGPDTIDEVISYPSSLYSIPTRTTTTTVDERGLTVFSIDEDYMQNGAPAFVRNSYNEVGSKVLEFTPAGVSTYTYSSDLRQRLTTSKAKGASATVTYEYGANGGGEVVGHNSNTLRKSTVIDENGVSSASFSDYKGNVILQKDGMGFETKYLYYPSDQLRLVIPPDSDENNTELNYQYTYTDDFKLESKTIPGRDPEMTYYLPDLELVDYVTLHNGHKISYEYEPDYPDFVNTIKLDQTVIKKFTPYHSDYKTNWVRTADSRVLGTSQFLQNTYSYDDIGRTDRATIQYLDGGKDEVTYIYDDMDNLRESTTVHSGNDEYETTHFYDFDKGLRLDQSRVDLPINGSNREITIHENTYDGRDWLTDVNVNDGLHTNTYKYHARGLLQKINSVENATATTEVDCEEEEEPPFIPGCEGPYLIDDVQLFYDCLQLASGESTSVTVLITSTMQYEDGTVQDIDDNTYAFGFNGGDASTQLSATTPAEGTFVNGGNGEVGLWILSILEDCLEMSTEGPTTLENSIQLEAMLIEMGLGGEDDDSDPDGPNGDPEPDAAASLFGMEIYYEEGNDDLQAVGYQNGNISWIEWKARGEAYQAYGYQYDNNYRLTGAQYHVEDPGNCFNVPDGAYNTSYGYDSRGNITTITRGGVKGVNSDGELEYGAIDDLIIKHEGTNQIKNVAESELDNKGYLSSGGSYTYEDGNLSSDPNISAVLYNHLDLPTSITGPNGTIKITYDSDGNKLRQVESPTSGPVTKTIYMGQMEYVDNERSSLYHEGGRIMYNAVLNNPEHPGPYDYEEWSISDHLGNVRIRYVDKDDDESITANPFDEIKNEVTGTYHYYPFGMRMEGNFYEEQGVVNRYQYNGIEHTSVLGPSIGLTMYRVHDAALGRWWQVDPKAEYLYGMSPYNSMGNNPILYNDPNGDFIHIAIGAAIGGIGNLAYQGFTGNISSIGDGFAAFGIGAVAGGVGAATGGASLAAMGTAGSVGAAIGAGAVSGAVGGASAGLIQNTGNAMYFGNQNFGDALTGPGLQGALWGGIGGAVIGGAVAGFSYKPNNISGGVNAANTLGDEAYTVTNAQGVTMKVSPPVPNAVQPAGGLDIAGARATGLYTGPVSSIGPQANVGGNLGGLNLFKFGSPQATTSSGWRLGDRFLNLPNRGTPQLNWQQNSGFLRQEMRLGSPIYDSYRLGNGNLIQTGGFLNAERSLLQTRGWIYNSSRGAWMPPG